MATLPSITSWFQEAPAPIISDSDFGDDHDKILSEAQELQNLLDNEEDKSLSRTQKQEVKLLNLTCAAMAVIADEAMKV
jgi:hypothetical protein